MTRDPTAPTSPRGHVANEVERLIAWMRARFADATLADGAGEAAAVVRLLERERDRLAHEARRQALRREARLGKGERGESDLRVAATTRPPTEVP